MSELTKQGVRDLNKGMPTKKVESPPLPLSDGMELINDLIYDDKEWIRDDISGRFPEAKLQGEPEEQLSVKGIRASRLTYYKFLLGADLAPLSFVFNLALYNDSATVETAMDDMCPGWREKARRKKLREAGHIELDDV